MKIYIYHSGHTEYVQAIINEIAKEEIEVVNQPSRDCDLFLSLQMGDHTGLLAMHKQAPEIPFITYVWDCYEWIWTHARGYDWKGYGELCKMSDVVLVPSEGQRDRLLQHWDIPKTKSRVVPAYARLFDYDDVKDGGYVCDPLRTIPDRHNGWAERACTELSIPYQHGGRGKGSVGKSWDDYKKFIAHSSFIICPWYEASTGGMSLVEGYNLGKDVLICNSPYMGARDYFGERATYFQPDYNSFKNNLAVMWETRHLKEKVDLEDRQNFCFDEFSLDTIVDNLLEELDYNWVRTS